MAVVLLGESGHGKSSVINALRDAEDAATGTRSAGTTWDIAAYPMGGLNLVDTPGFGCRHKSVPQLIADLEVVFSGQFGPVRGIVVTCPADSPRLTLGTHIIQALLARGFLADSWDQVLLLGTKGDRASEEDRAFFREQLVPHFFAGRSGGSSGCFKERHAVVRRGDCQELRTALVALLEVKVSIAYRAPEAEVLAQDLAELLGEETEEFADALARARNGRPSGPLNLLVIGECGDGKSTLINALRKESSPEQATGKSPAGVTKTIERIEGLPIAGRKVNLFDTPGIGDMDVSATDLCLMLEHVLSQGVVGGIDGVIVTSPALNTKIRLGGRLVQQLAELGFHGPNRWQHIIIAGTKADRADEEERRNFLAHVKEAFFAKAIQNKEQVGQAVLCEKGTAYDDLKAAICNLPDAKITYKLPDASELSNVLGNLLGVTPSSVCAQTKEIRLLFQQVEEQRQEAQHAAEELAHKEREFQSARLLLAAEEDRLQREKTDHEVMVAAHLQGQKQMEATERQRVEERSNLLLEQLQRLAQQKDAMLLAKSQEVEQHKVKLQQDRQRFVETVRQDLQSLASQRQDHSMMRRVEGFFTSLTRWL